MLAAQRWDGLLSATSNMTPQSFIVIRGAQEDDRCSGYDSQSDITVSSGHTLMPNRESMDWNYTMSAGMRTSRTPTDDFQEALIRLGTE